MNNFDSPTDFKFSNVLIYPHGSTKGIPITQLVSFIHYFESLTSPFLSATMAIVDTAGLLTDITIKGGEKIEIELKTAYEKDVVVKYEMLLYALTDRFTNQNLQSYNLQLISAEALKNEVTRVYKPLSGNPESITNNLLKNILKTKKEVYSEASRFEIKIMPNRQRPFDIISKMALKSVSLQNDYTSTNSENKGKSEQQIKGSGGFFFWESKRGFNFFSVDSLCADEKSKFKSKKLNSESWGPYVERAANQDDGADTRFTITGSSFSSNVNLMESLRMGKYSSVIAFFNHTTGVYEEYVYKIKDSYNSMAHLGSQEGLTLIPVEDIELSDYPSKIMTLFLDHELWYNEMEPASPDPKDGSKSPAKFADWQKFYVAQSIARYELLKNQTCVVRIPGNPNICAGDKIDIRLINKVPETRRREEPYDQESSGVYLVSEVTHTYDQSSGKTGKFETRLVLLRDSYGVAGRVSNHSANK